jgi:DNA-binding MarR family transcriptional regulator
MGSRAAKPARRSGHAVGAAERHAFYDALEKLLRIYQFRDRDRACYGAVTPNECFALEAVDRDRALSVGGLAAKLGLHKSNASRLADGLEARALVRRESDRSDGRAVRLALTAQGKRTHDAIRARVEALQAEIVQRYPPSVRRAFVRLLDDLAAEAAGRIAGCPPKEA